MELFINIRELISPVCGKLQINLMVGTEMTNIRLTLQRKYKYISLLLLATTAVKLLYARSIIKHLHDSDFYQNIKRALYQLHSVLTIIKALRSRFLHFTFITTHQLMVYYWKRWSLISLAFVQFHDDSPSND